MRRALIVGAFIPLLPAAGGCLAAAVQFGAEPTVFIVNLDAYPGYVFYVYLSGGSLDRDSVPFEQRWSKVEPGAPVRFPPARHGKTFGFDQTGTLYAVPKDFTESSGAAPQQGWFAGQAAGVVSLGNLPIAYARDDMCGQRSRSFHYQVAGAAPGLALQLLSQKDEYDFGQRLYCVIFLSPWSPALLLILLVGAIALGVRIVRLMQTNTIG